MKVIGFLLVAILFACSCRVDGVTIYAPPQLAEARILVDGKPVGRFQKTQREYRWLGWKRMKEELTAPPRSETIAKLPWVSAGDHALRIEKAGFLPIEKSFRYSAGHLEIEIDDADLKTTASLRAP